MTAISKWGPIVILLFLLILSADAVIQQNWLGTAVATMGVLLALAVTLVRRKSSGSTSETFDLMTGSAKALGNSSAKIYRATDGLMKISVAQAAAVTESSAALDEISSMVAKTNQSSQDLMQSAQHSKEAAEQGREILGELRADMGGIQQATRNLQSKAHGDLESLNRIIERFQEIVVKANLIKDIAMQSKLLSFNASVEAARAGEHGKGFAVVAEEMGNLAKTSGTAANEIDKILSEGAVETNNIVSHLKENLNANIVETISKVELGLAKMADVETGIAKILEAVDEVNTRSSEISAAAAEQDIGVREINAAVHDIQNKSEQLQVEAKEIHGASIALSQDAEKLNGAITSLSAAMGKKLEVSTELDFDGVIKAHLEWKMKLDKYLASPDGSLEGAKISRDDLCVLGKWIYGQGAESYANVPGFAQLRADHGTFHKIAGQIIDKINQKEFKAAQTLLAVGGEFMTASDNCIASIEKVRAQV